VIDLQLAHVSPSTPDGPERHADCGVSSEQGGSAAEGLVQRHQRPNSGDFATDLDNCTGMDDEEDHVTARVMYGPRRSEVAGH
jgi:ABC-type microcin C transport system permease subunit YejE